MSEKEKGNKGVRAANDSLGPDPHGQAAMLLIESLLHGLIERSVITVADAVSYVESASDVRSEIGHELRETPKSVERSRVILKSIASSLRFDLDGVSPKPVD